MSKLNVIVAVKDAAGDRLKSCLDSLINQTYEDMNVIVVDDCSKGNLADIIKEYADKYPSKIKAFCQDEEISKLQLMLTLFRRNISQPFKIRCCSGI